jgi:hypothetical protein
MTKLSFTTLTSFLGNGAMAPRDTVCFVFEASAGNLLPSEWRSFSGATAGELP